MEKVFCPECNADFEYIPDPNYVYTCDACGKEFVVVKVPCERLAHNKLLILKGKRKHYVKSFGCNL